MSNKPFTSHHSKILKEVAYSSAPARYGNETVTITRSTNRTLLEQTTTSIFKNFSNLKHRNPFKLYTQTDAIPGLQQALADEGTSFPFNTSDQQCGCHDTQQPLSSEGQIVLNQLRRNRLELMIMQEKMKQYPLQLKRKSTSTSVDSPSEMPQTSRIGEVTNPGFLNECRLTLRAVSQSNSSPPEKKIRKLELTKSPDLQKQEPSSHADNAKKTIKKL